MKKIISFVLSVAVMISMCSFSVGALNADDSILSAKSTLVEYFEDGTFLTVTLEDDSNGVMPLADSYIKSGSKTYTLMDSDKNVLWTFTLRGYFKVTTGVSATCTSALESYSISDDSWSVKNLTSSYSGNKAFGGATFYRKTLFITTDTRDVSLTITCDKNGVLS